MLAYTAGPCLNPWTDPTPTSHTFSNAGCRSIRGQKSEVRGQKSEVRSQRSEVRGRKSEVGSQRSEVRGQGSGVRGQRWVVVTGVLKHYGLGGFSKLSFALPSLRLLTLPYLQEAEERG